MSLTGATIKESLKNIDINTDLNGMGDFPLALKRSQIENGNVVPTSATGFNGAVAGNETGLVNGLLDGEVLKMTSTGKNLMISSTSVEDAGADTDGANRVNLRYLHTDGTIKSKVVQLTGQTPVSITGAADMVAVGIFIVITFGSGAATDGSATNLGNIYISLNGDTYTGGKPDTDIYGLIVTGKNTTQSSVILCPVGSRLRLNKLQMMSGINGNDEATIFFKSMSIPLNLIFTNTYPLSVGSTPDIDLSLQLDLNGACIFWANAIRIAGNGALAIGVNINAVLDSTTGFST